jgi:hypothetical protein
MDFLQRLRGIGQRSSRGPSPVIEPGPTSAPELPELADPSRGRTPILGLAPRRNLLTKTMGPGARAVPSLPFAIPITFLVAVPIEAQCYAVRLGFVNAFNFPFVISSASIYTSDSYGECAAMTADASSGRWFPVPTGAASERTSVTFDCAGSPNPPAGTPIVNTSGTTFSYTLPADPTNAGNASRPVTIKWSDFVPVTSIPQSGAPSGPHVLFIYITVGSSGMVDSVTNWINMSADPKAGGRRQYYGAVSWGEGRDYSTNPTETGFKRYPHVPQFALQYLTASCGIQCVTVGDSLAASPTNDLFSTPIWRAAADLSTQTLPIEVAAMLFSGANSTIYNVSLQNNAAAIRPSILFSQPLSRNDGVTIERLRTLLARSLAYSHELQSLYGTRLVLNSAGCEPAFDDNPMFIDAFNDILARLRAIGAEGAIPHIDGPSVLGQPGAPWRYIPGVSDDEMHFNSTGAELVVPLVKQALHSLIGM